MDVIALHYIFKQLLFINYVMKIEQLRVGKNLKIEANYILSDWI